MAIHMGLEPQKIKFKPNQLAWLKAYVYTDRKTKIAPVRVLYTISNIDIENTRERAVEAPPSARILLKKNTKLNNETSTIFKYCPTTTNIIVAVYSYA
ncbi:hypothetical protein ElyMa_001374200 [Elysia marginata]|uniref:Uncharacterized protein n=1 Tax=Elysia marginata TaxID=1093978 RepID=A0AAV4IQU5_9GAST|nr:hypothetical protein ElyMa_001374200 [Elysia marginata]